MARSLLNGAIVRSCWTMLWGHPGEGWGHPKRAWSSSQRLATHFITKIAYHIISYVYIYIYTSYITYHFHGPDIIYHLSFYYCIILSCYHISSYIIISSYHHEKISSYHHIIIYHHITILSYHHIAILHIIIMS